MQTKTVNFFWFRRDLRLHDNAGFYRALTSGKPVIPLFIFDRDILDKLEIRSDERVRFIYQEICTLAEVLRQKGGFFLVEYGKPVEIWKKLADHYDIETVYANHDYEPYALARDREVKKILAAKSVRFETFQDQVIFEKSQVIKEDGQPYVVFTPYKNKWLDHLHPAALKTFPSENHLNHLLQENKSPLPSSASMDFAGGDIQFPPRDFPLDIIRNYDKTRDFPAGNGTTRLGIHLRFGTISIRELVKTARELNTVFLSELIWREFFMMILHHFPHVTEQPFKKQYSDIEWINSKEDFERWCAGKTGYPMVDAGMRELNETGYMHNRVRMITASFLTKHLLINWQWGEKYFAGKLLDFELSSNNGNWQWAAGCGCDAAPYFRIFNPATQIKKFDPEYKYIEKWVPEWQSDSYPKPMIEHKFARQRALDVYGRAVKSS